MGLKIAIVLKKALKWLEDHRICCQLHDFRIDSLDDCWLLLAESVFGWEKLVNKRSTTWRNLDIETKENLSKSTALSLLKTHPTLIKRPIILQDNIALIGFDEEDYKKVFVK